MAEPISGAVVGGAAAALGTSIVGWLFRVLLKREIDRNDDRHKKSEQAVESIREDVTQLRAHAVTQDGLDKTLNRLEAALKENAGDLKADLREHRREVNESFGKLHGRVDSLMKSAGP